MGKLTAEQKVKLHAAATGEAYDHSILGDGNDANGLDATDRSLIQNIAPALQAQMSDLNLSDAQAKEYATDFLKLFNNDSGDAAQFLLKSDANPDVAKLLESATTPDEAFKATEGLVAQFKQDPNSLGTYASQQLASAGQATTQNTGQAQSTSATTSSATVAQQSPASTVLGATVATNTGGATTSGGTASGSASTGATAEIDPLKPVVDLVLDHVKNNPDDKALAKHFMDRIKGNPPDVEADPELLKALEEFKKNNANLLSAKGDDNMMEGFFNKDQMIHDLLDSYKNTPDKAIAGLSDPNFQQQAFMQYSSIGNAFGFILQPIMNMLGGVTKQGENLAGWAQADFGDTMKDFQHFFNQEMGSVMGMSNNNLGLMASLDKVMGAVGNAFEDAMDITRFDREYMTRHNPDAPNSTLVYVEPSTNQIQEVQLAGDPTPVKPQQNTFEEDPDNNLKGYETAAPTAIA